MLISQTYVKCKLSASLLPLVTFIDVMSINSFRLLVGRSLLFCLWRHLLKQKFLMMMNPLVSSCLWWLSHDKYLIFGTCNLSSCSFIANMTGWFYNIGCHHSCFCHSHGHELSFSNIGFVSMVITIHMLDRIRKIYKTFPQIPVPHHLGDLGDDDDVQELSEALGAAKTRVEGCSSFLKAAIK